jgi:mRNA interferase MazF
MDVGRLMVFGRGDVVLVRLDPSKGNEIQKTRPCVIVSPDELNNHLRTRIIAPMTTGSHTYAFRIPCHFKGKSGHVVLDQIRTIDTERIVTRVGRLQRETVARALAVLRDMFAP